MLFHFRDCKIQWDSQGHPKIEQSDDTLVKYPTQRRPDFNAQHLHLFAREITSPKDKTLDILPSFTNVTYLRIDGWDFRGFDGNSIDALFCGFYKSVKALMLVDCCVASNVLVYLTSRFTLVEDLWIEPRGTEGELCGIESFQLPLVNPQFQGFKGNLVIVTLEGEHEKFLKFVSDNSSNLHSIQVSQYQGLEHLFKVDRSKLAMIAIDPGFGLAAVSLESCTELRTLWIKYMGQKFGPNGPCWKILSTIKPGHLKEIKVHCSFHKMNEDAGTDKKWEKIDNHLCRLNARVALLPNRVDCTNWLREHVREILPKACNMELVTVSMDG